MEDYRSPSLLFSDLSDASRFACRAGPPAPGGAAETTAQHPQLELSRPHHKVHVHLEDKAAGPTSHVLWDGIYDMGGTEVLKASAPALGGLRPAFEKICPPVDGPPHWYELTVSDQGVRGMRPRMLENFAGLQVLESYTPDHDPELGAFSVDLSLAACALQ
mmetsp:Transcript_2150/g.4334  ORF Transcript_2150/g.4334 Transcript_2150/m.4334 type:complete len:161 (-) Transcript_2150:73-555(-)